MVAEQMHYTTCRYGLTGHAGSQTRATSEALPSPDRSELERLGMYAPPRNLPTQPDADSVQALFPKSYRVGVLGSGRPYIVRSAYVGADYTGRFGNFFAHALVLDGALHDRWPIDLYEWEGWKSLLEDHEDREPPAPLPQVDVEAIPIANSFTADALSKFLNEVSGRTALLATLLRTVFDQVETRHPIVIRTSEMDGLYWIACIQKAFPIAYQHALSFSTYQFDPRTCLALNATTGETDIRPKMEGQIYTFAPDDLEQGAQNVETHDDYAAIVARWMSESPQILSDYWQFADGFEHGMIEPDLIHLARLFQLSIGEPTQIGCEALGELLEFADRFAKPARLGSVLEAVAGNLAAVLQGGRPADYERILRFECSAAVATGSPQHRDLAWQTWMQMLDDLLAGRHEDHQRTFALHEELLTHHSAHRAEFAQALVEERHLDYIELLLPSLAPEPYGWWLELLLNSVADLGVEPSWAHPAVERTLDFLAAEPQSRLKHAAVALIALSVDPEAVTSLAVQLSRAMNALPKLEVAHAKNELGAGLADALDNVIEPDRMRTRHGLDNEDGFDVLVGEWKRHFEAAPDKYEFYNAYLENILAELPGFRDTRSAELAELAYELMDATQRAALAESWVQRRVTVDLPAHLSERVLAAVAESIPLDPSTLVDDTLMKQLAAEMTRIGSKSSPDRVALRHAIQIARMPEADRAEFELGTLPQSLEGLGEEEYTTFLRLFLLAAFCSNCLGSATLHGKVLEAAYIGEATGVFRAAYLEQLVSPELASNTWLGTQVPLRFWIDQRFVGVMPKGVSKLHHDALKVLEDRLSSWSNDRWEMVQHWANSWCREEQVGTSTRREWESLSGRISKRRAKGILGKLFSS